MIPDVFIQATTLNFGMGHLLDRHRHDGAESEGERQYFPQDTLEWLLGYRLPTFQRPPVWKRSQAVRFVESAWLGFHLGTYVVNRVDRWANGRPHPTDLWLIDGQQRLRALERYFKNEFAVFDLKWSQLERPLQLRFSSITFSCSTVSETNEAKLREMYDRLNFGGTPHKKSQRATGNLDDADSIGQSS